MSSRTLALQVLDRVEAGELLHLVFADEVALSNLSPRDRHLAQELCYGVTRMRIRYDAYISELAHSAVPEGSVRNIIRLGLHQLLALRLADHAAINETVELTRFVKQPAKTGLVNALLRSAQRLGPDQLLGRITSGIPSLKSLSIRYSHPEWVISELLEQLTRCELSADLEDALAHNNSLPSVQLAIASAHAQAEVERQAPTSQTALPGCLTLEESLDVALLNDDVWVQDLASQAIARAFHSLIPAGARVVADACAAPGGKSRLLRSLLPAETQLLSMDKSAQRLRKLREAARGDNWAVETADFTKIQGEEFDAVLIDAPCSSLGSVRRKPDTKYRTLRTELPGYSDQQLSLLEAAWRSLKPGGIVGYATCTPTVAETDRVVRQTMKLGWQSLDAPTAIRKLSAALVVSTRPNGAALLWGHQNESDTMFLSLLRKPEA